MLFSLGIDENYLHYLWKKVLDFVQFTVLFGIDCDQKPRPDCTWRLSDSIENYMYLYQYNYDISFCSNIFDVRMKTQF